jgi:hypothetical protein
MALSGKVKAPAAMDWANEMVVSGSTRDASRSHGTGAHWDGVAHNKATEMQNRIRGVTLVIVTLSRRAWEDGAIEGHCCGRRWDGRAGRCWSEPFDVRETQIRGFPCIVVPGFPMPETTSDCSLTAYRLPNRPSLKLIPASADRTWMELTRGGWANRCLPLRMANQSGWLILNDADFEVTWDGKPGVSGVHFKPLKGALSYFAKSMFGYGIITWEIPFLFRTSPGYNLLARGPSNEFKDGVQAMDGLVETDWSEASFTMNWKITRPFKKTRFDKDEPICMIMPQRRGEMESIKPEIRNLESAPEMLEGFNAWRESRLKLVERKTDPRAASLREWEGHYMRGTTVTGTPAPEHQTKREMRPFAELEPATYQTPPTAGVAQTPAPSLLRRLFSKR